MTAALFEGAGPSSLLHELPSSKLELPKNRVGRMDQVICVVFFCGGDFHNPTKQKKDTLPKFNIAPEELPSQ